MAGSMLRMLRSGAGVPPPLLQDGRRLRNADLDGMRDGEGRDISFDDDDLENDRSPESFRAESLRNGRGAWQAPLWDTDIARPAKPELPEWMLPESHSPETELPKAEPLGTGLAETTRTETTPAETTQAETTSAVSPQTTMPRRTGAAEALCWRAFDVLASLAILIFLLPALMMLAVLLYCGDPGPIFYRHRRIGYQGRYFDCLKFRSMKTDGDALLREHLRANPAARMEWGETQKLRDDPRVTKVGAIVRKLSLDEFPQLLNVLLGDMSLVGPRPIVEGEVWRYGRHFEHYCLVRPGLTGLWQTSGRSDTSYQQRVELDVSYVVRKGLLLDFWLLCKTVPVVLLARGSY